MPKLSAGRARLLHQARLTSKQPMQGRREQVDQSKCSLAVQQAIILAQLLSKVALQLGDQAATFCWPLVTARPGAAW
jgi:hypothetical protein